MKLYIKQKVFSWGDKFYIFDENENDCFYVEGEVFSLGKKLHLYNMAGEELAFIHQRLMTLLPKYDICRNGVDVAEVVKEFTFFHQKYRVDGLGWEVSGDFLSHEYEITDQQGLVAAISRHWFTWGDSYEIDIAPDVDVVMALCVVLVIDAVLASGAAAAASAASH